MAKIVFKWNLFFRILTLFAIAQAAGIYAAYRLLPELEFVQPGRVSDFNFYDLLFLAGFIVIFVLLIKRFRKAGSVFFRVFLALIIFAGAQAFLSIWFGPNISVLITIALIFLFWFFNNVFIQDLIMLLTFAGIGAVLGLSLTPTAVVLILVGFSFYDIIAVYKTKHMIKLAEAMIESRAIFGFVIPGSARGLKERMSKVAPGDQFMILGSGDVILPMLLSASLVRVSMLQSVIVAAFSLLGLLLMHLIFTNQKIRRPMAALPPIAMLTVIGYLVAIFF
ncbi:MAG: presenilin family intramembrane aspartyl protease [Candidatus Paceibacterota bacterium]